MQDPSNLMDQVQAPHLDAFRLFWHGLAPRKDVFCLFFTSGLLHWALRSLRRVPRNVHVALVGSHLKPDEIEWIRRHVEAPFHHVALPVDDKTIWEFLFATSRENFGWLDVDCLVVEPALFDEVRQIPADALASTVWSYPVPGGHDMLCTYFVFLNAEAIAKVTGETGVSPTTYSWETTQASRLSPWAYCRRPTPAIAQCLAGCVPPGPDGRPIYLSERSFYDTLQVYQLVAQTYGYRVHHVRRLPRNRTSPEIAHVGRVSYYEHGWADKDRPENREIYAATLQSDFLVLSDSVEALPPTYRERWMAMRGRLQALGLPATPPQIRTTLAGLLQRQGLGESALASLLEPVV